MINDPRILSDPAFFSKLDHLELRARSVVEGFMHGLHRSPFVGFSVEFAAHRKYVQGDDLRHVNWKIYARQQRLYVKQFDAETNMNLYLLLDISGSMSCQNRGLSKLDYAATLAGALAHLALKQHDAAGLILFADEVVAHVPPRAQPHQLQEIFQAIRRAEPQRPSNTARALTQAAELCRHRGMVVVLSDLFEETAAVMQGLEALRFRKHEVLLFHIWDQFERYLPLEGHCQFRDLETGAQVVTQAEGIRDAYLQQVADWCQEVESQCRNRAIDRMELTTDMPVDQALLEYLVKRSRSY